MKRFALELGLLALLTVIILGAGTMFADWQDASAQPADVGEVTDPAGAPETPPDGAEDPTPDGADVTRGTGDGVGGSTSAGTEAGDDEADDDSGTAGELVAQLAALVQAGKYGAAGGILLLLVIAGLRTVVLGSWIPWFKTRIGGYVLAFLTAFGAVIGVAAAAEVSITVGLLGAAVWAGAGAIGLHTGQKDLRAWWKVRKAAS